MNIGAAGVATMQGDGNFVVYDSGGGAVWHTYSNGNPGAYLAVQDDSNLDSLVRRVTSMFPSVRSTLSKVWRLLVVSAIGWVLFLLGLYFCSRAAYMEVV